MHTVVFIELKLRVPPTIVQQSAPADQMGVSMTDFAPPPLDSMVVHVCACRDLEGMDGTIEVSRLKQ
jgi:hypothetical protein